MSDAGMIMENITSIAALVVVSHVRKSKPETVAVPPDVTSSKEPLPYDPMLGWYTAATLSGLLVLFLACVGLEKIKDRILVAFDKNHPLSVSAAAAAAATGRDHPCAGAGTTGPGAGAAQPPPPKGSADTESDALLGGITANASPVNATTRNCVDHNYVFLTLDRQNHSAVALPSLPPVVRPPAATSSTTPPATTGRLVPQPGSGEWEEGSGGDREAARTPTAVRTHNVKIEIVEVHSESPVHDMAIIEERDDVGGGGGGGGGDSSVCSLAL